MLVAPTVPMRSMKPRLRVVVEGKVLYVEVGSHDAPATLTARIVDGTGTLDCVFLGRRTIPGIEPGARVRVEGVVTQLREGPAVFNPRYELMPL